MAASVDYPNFVDTDFGAWSTKPVRTNDGGKGKTVYMDGPRHFGGTGIVTARLGDDMPLLFPIRPNMNVTEFKGGEEQSKRLNIELGIPEGADALAAKLQEFDDWCVDQGYKANTSSDDKVVWYGDLKMQLGKLNKEMGRVMVLGKYKAFLKRGGARDGKQFSDSCRIKGDGWFDYIADFIKEEREVGGIKQLVVKDCLWKDRLVTAPLGERDTKFFLYVPKLKRYTDKVPCLGADGRPIITGTTSDGKPIYQMRWVGPQDAKIYSRITPVVSFPKMYVSAEFGPTVVAKELYVKAAPPRSKSKLAGHDVDTNVSAEDALAALTETADASEAAAESDGEEEGGAAATGGAAAGGAGAAAAPHVAEAAEAHEAAAAATEEPASATGERIGRKRARGADDDEAKPRAKKHRAAPVVEDDF